MRDSKLDLSFRHNPFLYVSLSLIAGILSHGTLGSLDQTRPFITSALAGSAMALCLAAIILFYKGRLFLSLTSSLATIALGACLLTASRQKEISLTELHEHLQAEAASVDKVTEVIGFVAREPEERDDRVILHIAARQLNAARLKGQGDAIIRMSVLSPQPAELARRLGYGDRVRVLASLRPPRGFQNPGSFDYASYLKRNGIAAVATVKSPLLVQVLSGSDGSAVLRLAQRIRRAIRDKFKEHLSGMDAGIALALTLGDRSQLDARTEDAFKRTGLYHILVISGLQVSILAFILFQLFKLSRLNEKACYLLTMLSILFYALLVELSSPIVRASAMVIAFLLGRMVFRQATLLNALAFSAFLLLAANPHWLYDVGFQLTFACVLAIALMGVPLAELLFRPVLLGLSSLFSQQMLFLKRTPEQRRIRRVRFAVELLIERIEDRWPSPSRKAWQILGKLCGRFFYGLGSLLCVSAAIQLFLTPLMAAYFNRVSLLAVLANLVIVPLANIMLILVLALAFISWISLWLSGALAALIGKLMAIILLLVNRIDSLPYAHYRIPNPPGWLLLGFFASLAIVISGGRRLRLFAALALSACYLLIVIHPFPPRIDRDRLSVTVLDVGQGDSIFVQFPRGQTMLIDGGGLPRASPELAREAAESYRNFDIGEEVVSRFLWAKGLKGLDYIILSHPHRDHILGLFAVVRNFSIGKAFVNPCAQPTPDHLKLLDELRKRGIPFEPLVADKLLLVDGVQALVLNPDASGDSEAVRPNNASIVMKLSYGHTSCLLTGDIESDVEAKLVGRCRDLASDVIKVPHHGSRSSSSVGFLRCVSPKLAIISAGAVNPFGHPSAEVISRYSDMKAKVLRTDRDGAVTVALDGRKVSVRTFRSR